MTTWNRRSLLRFVGLAPLAAVVAPATLIADERLPMPAAGEMVFWNKGATILFKNDGSITIHDGRGAGYLFKGNGEFEVLK
jgi:hypothetical protein